MDSLAQDIISEYDELVSTFNDIADQFEDLKTVESLMEELNAAVENVRIHGLDEESFHLFDKTLRDDATNQLPVLVQHAEEIAQKKKEGLLKRFWEGIKKIILKICDFFAKLFNRTEAESKAILNAKIFDFKKPVMTLSKAEYIKYGQCVMTLTLYCDQHGLSMDRTNVTDSYSLPKDMEVMCKAFPSILELDAENYRIKIRPEAFYLANQSLQLAGYSTGDVMNITRAFQARERKVSNVAVKWRSLTNKLLEAPSVGLDERNAALMRAIIRLNTTAYTSLAKLEHCTSKQIHAFYECIIEDVEENLRGGVREQDPEEAEQQEENIDGAEPSTESFKEVWESLKNKVGIMFDNHDAMRKFIQDSMSKFSDLRGTYYVRTVMPNDLKKVMTAIGTMTDILNETRKGKAVDLSDYKNDLEPAGVDLKEDGQLYTDRFKVGNWGAGANKSKLSSPMTFRKTIDDFGWKSAASSCAGDFVDSVKTVDKKQIATAIDNHAKDLIRVSATKQEKSDIKVDKKVALNQIKNVLNARDVLIKFAFSTLRRVLSAYTQSGDTSGF